MSHRFELVDGIRKPRKKWAKANAQGEWRMVRVSTKRDGTPYVHPPLHELANSKEVSFDDLFKAKAALSNGPSIPTNYTPFAAARATWGGVWTRGRASNKASAIIGKLFDDLPVERTYIEFDDASDAMLYKLTWGGK